MTTGFFGKIPAAGDFVGRGLAGSFVRAWDPWISRNVVPLIASKAWPGETPLFFLAGADFLGPMVGLVMPSRDKAGRQYPLTIAARPTLPDLMLLVDAHAWFEDILDAALIAVRGDVDPGKLGEHLLLLRLPEAGAPSRPVRSLCVWVDPNDVVEADPSDPAPALETLLKTPLGAAPGTE